MNQDERRFDFHGLGLALKQSQRGKGLDTSLCCGIGRPRLDRTIMNIENKGQHPSFNLFFKARHACSIYPVDQFILYGGQPWRKQVLAGKHIDVLLDSMNEKELVVMEATAEGLKKARETEVPEVRASVFLRHFRGCR